MLIKLSWNCRLSLAIGVLSIRFKFRINISSQGCALVSILITVGTSQFPPRVLLVSSMCRFLHVSIKFKLDSGDLDRQLFYRKIHASSMHHSYLSIGLDQLEIVKKKVVSTLWIVKNWTTGIFRVVWISELFRDSLCSKFSPIFILNFLEVIG